LEVSINLGAKGIIVLSPVPKGDVPPLKIPKAPMSDPMATRVLLSSIVAMELSKMKKVKRIRNNESIMTKPTLLPESSSTPLLLLAMA
jgi:hypothetical protein